MDIITSPSSGRKQTEAATTAQNVCVSEQNHRSIGGRIEPVGFGRGDLDLSAAISAPIVSNQAVRIGGVSVVEHWVSRRGDSGRHSNYLGVRHRSWQRWIAASAILSCPAGQR